MRFRKNKQIESKKKGETKRERKRGDKMKV